jgi:hypothetical protein
MAQFPKIFNQILKISYNFNPLLQNQVVLYFFFFLTIADMFYLANIRDFNTLTIIILTGFLTSFFSKNMIVILCVALCVAHVLKYGTGNKFSEGATTMADSKEETEDDKHDVEESKPKDSMKKSADKKESVSKEGDKKKKAKDDLMKGLKDFQSVQGDLVSGIEKLQPMLDKAEAFVEKYENYKNMN